MSLRSEQSLKEPSVRGDRVGGSRPFVGGQERGASDISGAKPECPEVVIDPLARSEQVTVETLIDPGDQARPDGLLPA